MASSAAGSKKISPSAERNKGPIWNILETKVFPKFVKNEKLNVLEIAAGAGVHSEHFCTNLLQMEGFLGKEKEFQWYPTDPDESSRLSIVAYYEENKNVLKNILKPPFPLTLGANGSMEQDIADCIPESSLDAIICINMIHISPWEATIGLMKIAGRYLKQDGLLYCFGPYKENGTIVQSNLGLGPTEYFNSNIDISLKSRDPSWGVRNLEDVVKLAEESGLHLVERIEMPANNLSVIYQKKK